MVVPSLPLLLLRPRSLRRQSVLALRPLGAARMSASRCRVVVVLLLVVPYDSIWDSVMPMTGNFSLVPVSSFLRVCMHAELLVQQLCGPYVLRGVFALRCRVVVTVSLLMVLTILHGTV